MFAIYL